MKKVIKKLVVGALALMALAVTILAQCEGYNIWRLSWDQDAHMWRWDFVAFVGSAHGVGGYMVIDRYGIPMGGGDGRDGSGRPGSPFNDGAMGGSSHCHIGYMHVPCSFLMQTPIESDPVRLLHMVETHMDEPLHQLGRNIILNSWIDHDVEEVETYVSRHADESVSARTNAATVAALLVKKKPDRVEGFISSLPSPEAKEMCLSWRGMDSVAMLGQWGRMAPDPDSGK